MPFTRLRDLEGMHGDLHRVIPELVNAYGQNEAGRRLGVSSATVNRWLKDNGYRRKTCYERDGKQVR